MVYSSLRICQYSATSGGTSCLSFGNPAEIIFRSWMYSLSAAASFFILAMWMPPMFAFVFTLLIKACSITLIPGAVDWGTGILDIVFRPVFFIPGMCITVNLYRRVGSRILSTLGLVILSRSQLLNMGTNGLWSTATISFWQPRTNIRQLSRANSTASASPSIGAYLLSESVVNLDPAYTTFQ